VDNSTLSWSRSLSTRPWDLLGEAGRLGVTLTAYCPLARGAVIGHAIVSDIARRHGRTDAQIVLRWIVQQGVAAIAMTTKPGRCRPALDSAAGRDRGMSDVQAQQRREQFWGAVVRVGRFGHGGDLAAQVTPASRCGASRACARLGSGLSRQAVTTLKDVPARLQGAPDTKMLHRVSVTGSERCRECELHH
jgi:hypothetical protein